MMLDNETYNPKWTGDPTKYLDGKLKILTDPKGFCVHPTEKEMAHLRTLKTQTAIDNGILQVINNHWN